jgi:pimeloyl-ACP methyl ester carboxylesterase
MKAILSMALVLGVCGLAGAADKVDPVGTWKCEYKIGDKMLTAELTIKKDGDKLVGTMSWPDQKDAKLKDVKLKDDTLTFSAVRKFMDNEIPIDFTLKIDGDKFKGKAAAEFMGNKPEYDIEGKREKLMMFVPAVVSAQQKPTTGYAPVNGIKMYYEVHGSGEPVVLLHGAFMTITNNWTGWIDELSRTRKVIAVEMQGHGRTADTKRDITYENLADDVAALLKELDIPRADLIGYSMGGTVAMQCAIRHPDKVRKVVVISSVFRRDGMVKEALDMFPKLTADAFKGSPIEVEYKKLSPTPDDFPKFVKRLLATASSGHDLGADKLKATTAPMFFIHGDADGIRLEHVAEMFRLKGGEIHGDMKPRSTSRLAILPNTTHVTLMQRIPIIVPMVNDFLDAKP